MSISLATIFQGDVTLETGSDPNLFGYGDLKVFRKAIINGTENSTGSPSVGSVLISGGVRIDKNLHVQENLNVLYGNANLTVTNISTGNGPTTIQGFYGVNIDVTAASRFVSNNDLSMQSINQTLQLSGGKNTISAVGLYATHQNGGITLMSGNVNGGINIGAGASGIVGTTSYGNLNWTANNASGNFIVNSSLSNQNLNLTLNGNTESQIKIESAGIPGSSGKDAILINTSNTDGKITISNNNGLGLGSLTSLVGSGGLLIRTNTGGSVSVVSQGAGSEFLVKSPNSGDNMIIGIDTISDSSLILKSAGTDVTNKALLIQTVNTGGSIMIQNTQGSKGGVTINAGESGFVTNTTNGSTNITTYNSTSLFTNQTLFNSQDLTVSVSGGTNSKVNILSDGTSDKAININTTTGGIYINSGNKVNIQGTGDINIGTTSSVPINIGTNSNVTTINGDLVVQGTTTTINTNVVTIEDNIILVNSAPTGMSDGGMGIKRYQVINDLGNIYIGDTPELVGDSQGADGISIILDSNAENSNNFYNGWWIKITDGKGADQVRRIKSYIGSSKVANIYKNGEEDGSDFITFPNGTGIQQSKYALYPCQYVLSIWDETNDEFAFVCSAESPAATVKREHYADLHINNLIANNINAATINNTLSDMQIEVILNDNTNLVPVTNFPKVYGIYLLFVRPRNINFTSYPYAIFMIGRINDDNFPGTVIRLISVKGTGNGAHLDMQWPAGGKPQLYYRQTPGTATSCIYDMKLISI